MKLPLYQLLISSALMLSYTCSSFAAQTPAAANCELSRKIVYAGLDWDSNRFLVEVSRFIVEHGYGCKTDAIPGSTIPLLTGLAKGDVDIMLEVWKDNIKDAWAKYLKAKQVVELKATFTDAVQGFFVPRYLVEGSKAPAPDLKSVSDLPKYKRLFKDREEPRKGRFYNCIFGWSCEVINTNKLKAYGLDEHFVNFRPGTGAALASAIASAYARRQPFVAYYWGPSWVLGKYDLVRLEEPPFNETHWLSLQDENAKNPVGVAYPAIDVYTGVSASFHAKAPALVDFLTKFELSAQEINLILGKMQHEHLSASDAARAFLSEKRDYLTRWVPNTVAARVHAALDHQQKKR